MNDVTETRVPLKGAVLQEGNTPTPEKLTDGQYADHWVLSDEERAKGFVRPVRLSYKHLECGSVTSMPQAIAETYAREPSFYGHTFCVNCGGYFSVGAEGEFVWADEENEKVGA